MLLLGRRADGTIYQLGLPDSGSSWAFPVSRHKVIRAGKWKILGEAEEPLALSFFQNIYVVKYPGPSRDKVLGILVLNLTASSFKKSLWGHGKVDKDLGQKS